MIQMRFSNWKSRVISPGQSSPSVKDFDGNRYYLLRHSCVSSPTPLICCSSNLSSGTHLTPFASVTWFLATACTYQPHAGPRTWTPPPRIVAHSLTSLRSLLKYYLIRETFPGNHIYTSAPRNPLSPLPQFTKDWVEYAQA